MLFFFVCKARPIRLKKTMDVLGAARNSFSLKIEAQMLRIGPSEAAKSGSLLEQQYS